jgi:hypothetical protein
MANVPPDVLAQAKAQVQEQMAEAFGTTFWVALAILVVTLIPAFMLPRKARETVGEEPAAPVVLH